MKTTTADGVLTIAMDRPETLNSVDADELRRLGEAVVAGGADDEVAVIVIRGDERAFCSGANLADPGALSAAAEETIDAANFLIQSIVDAPKPVVTLARGVVAGIGVPLAAAGDLVLSSDSSFFVLAFPKVGLMPDGGATALIAASIGRARAMRMALLAERIPADEALASGLVTHVFPSDRFDEESSAVIAQLAAGPRVAYRLTKSAINAATLGALPGSLAAERAGQTSLLTSPDFLEGASAFNERRAPLFRDR